MYPKSIQKLIELFAKFPGIGPRQAGRFAFFILKENDGFARELTDSILDAKNKITTCGQCFRAVEKNGVAGKNLCVLCQNAKRDPAVIAVVEKESDMQNLEKSGEFTGLYHLLGGFISPLDQDSPKKLHLRELFMRIKKILEQNGRAEIILATNTTTEGDTTALYIERILAPLKDNFPDLKISRLARGLSLGSELEYADEITIKNALTNRK